MSELQNAPAVPAAARVNAQEQTVSRVRQAIASASRQSDVGFDYLLAQARIESGLDPNARSRASSAAGLFQFVESTWLSLLQKYGQQFGQGKFAHAITTITGIADIADPALKAEALALRNQPETAAHMAAALAKEHQLALAPVLGRAPDAGELYLAHFLGQGEAKRFLAEHARDPAASGAILFPKAAAANRPIFYASGGRERNLDQILGLLREKVGAATGPAPMQTIPGMAQRIRTHQASEPTPRSIDPIHRPALSSVLQRTFAGVERIDPAAGARVDHAYRKLRELGL